MYSRIRSLCVMLQVKTLLCHLSNNCVSALALSLSLIWLWLVYHRVISPHPLYNLLSHEFRFYMVDVVTLKLLNSWVHNILSAICHNLHRLSAWWAIIVTIDSFLLLFLTHFLKIQMWAKTKTFFATSAWYVLPGEED